jgi:tetratricopeptide (TPR) repeat protein
MKQFAITLAGIMLILASANAQKGIDDGSKYGHGKDSINCLTNLSLYSEFFKQKEYKDAFPFWEKVINECPYATASLYANGAIMLRSFIDAEASPEKKETYYQQLMSVYDKRIQYFGTNAKYPTSYILGLKAMDMLRYKRDDSKVCKEAYLIMNQSITDYKDKTQPSILVTHLSNSISLYKRSQIEPNEVIDAYLLVSETLNTKLATATEESDDLTTLNETRETIDKLFASSGTIDCETIVKIFTPLYESNSNNVVWLKRVSSLLSEENCETDLTFKVATTLYQLEPTANAARSLAIMNLRKKETEKAIQYYQEAIKLELVERKKALLLYEVGLIYSSLDNYASARQYFQQAINANPNWGDPYIQIGNLYSNSAMNCGKDEFEKKTSYWAAVDKYMKAKNIDTTVVNEANKQIAITSAHFPTKEEIFFQGLEEGASYTIKCWINESTTIRAKK